MANTYGCKLALSWGRESLSWGSKLAYYQGCFKFENEGSEQLMCSYVFVHTGRVMIHFDFSAFVNPFP